MRVTNFVASLFEMTLDESPHNHICRFSEAGDAILILNPQEFQETVLPKYFKHNKIRSFQRQLNQYGFKAMWNMSYYEYKHPFFLKGRPDLLVHVRRRNHSILPGMKRRPGPPKGQVRKEHEQDDDDDQDGGFSSDEEGQSHCPLPANGALAGARASSRHEADEEEKATGQDHTAIPDGLSSLLLAAAREQKASCLPEAPSAGAPSPLPPPESTRKPSSGGNTPPASPPPLQAPAEKAAPRFGPGRASSAPAAGSAAGSRADQGDLDAMRAAMEQMDASHRNQVSFYRNQNAVLQGLVQTLEGELGQVKQLARSLLGHLQQGGLEQGGDHRQQRGLLEQGGFEQGGNWQGCQDQTGRFEGYFGSQQQLQQQLQQQQRAADKGTPPGPHLQQHLQQEHLHQPQQMGASGYFGQHHLSHI